LTTERLYTTSTAELERRLRAYATLIISLWCGIALSSIDYLFSAPVIWFICLAGLALCLMLSRLALARSLRNYSQLELRLSESSIERTRGDTSESYQFASVIGLRIVRTTRKATREITATFSNGRRLSMNAVEDFGRFEQELRSRLPTNVSITEAKEPIDYDHPMFYAVFGAITGLAFTLAVRAMSGLSEEGLGWASLGIAGYAFILGAWVLVSRPLSQRYGPKSRFGDFVLGLFALLAGAFLAARSLLH